MNLSLESRKLSIMEYLAEIQDESIIQQIENLLKPTVDFWDQLSGEEKASIKKGIKELDQGKRTAYKDFIEKYRAAKS